MFCKSASVAAHANKHVHPHLQSKANVVLEENICRRPIRGCKSLLWAQVELSCATDYRQNWSYKITLSCWCFSSCTGSLLELKEDSELFLSSWGLQPGLRLAFAVLMNHSTGLHQSNVVQGQTLQEFQANLCVRKAAKTPFNYFFRPTQFEHPWLLAWY